MISLEQLLESRDRRANHQRCQLEAYPGRVLLCLTVQLPGSVKRNQTSLAIAEAGVEAVRQAFAPEYEELKDLETGFEGYFIVPGNPLEIKRLTCEIEDSHPLGRLMDIDVLAVSDADSEDERLRAQGSRWLREIGFSGTVPTNIFPMPQALQMPIILNRETIGLPPRKCLLCGLPARVCMRAHTHSQAELLDKIEQMVKSYKNLPYIIDK